MSTTPSRDTQLCISLAGRPGTFGVRFHNHLYQQLGLDFYYKAMRTDDLPAAVAASACARGITPWRTGASQCWRISRQAGLKAAAEDCAT